MSLKRIVDGHPVEMDQLNVPGFRCILEWEKDQKETRRHEVQYTNGKS